METYYHIHNTDYTGDMPPEYYKFPYSLDHFQLHGCNAISKNENVLATAHTGSGKTVVCDCEMLESIKEGCLYFSN